MLSKTCPVCKKEFIQKKAIQKHCCKKCWLQDYSLGGVTKNCVVCKKEFNQKKASQRHCSKKCSHQSNLFRNSKNCLVCKKEFIPTSPNQKYCCRECTLQIHQPKVGKVKKNCPVCKKEFIKTSNRQLYCSYKCLSKSDRFTSVRKKYREKHYKKINNRICLTCNNEFTPSKSHNRTQNFCSKKCYEKSDQWKKVKTKSDKKYRSTEKSKIRRIKWTKKRIKSDPMFKIITITRSRLWNILKYKNIKKPKSTISLIGCSQKFLKDYLEKQFYPHPETNEPMTWENHSKTGWHIDHIVPLDKAKNEKDIIELCHYTNLQPMWAEYNIKKGNKLFNEN